MDKLRSYLESRGFDCNNYKDSIIHRKIESQMRKVGLTDYDDYLGALNMDEHLYEELIDALTTNFTEFFRDISVFQKFSSNILPEIIAQKEKRKGRILRVWSAGCSSCEEPYSIAILLKELLSNEDYIISITATDIDNKSLQRARKAEYTKEHVKNILLWGMDNHFTHIGEKYTVKPDIKKTVRVLKHDMLKQEPFTHFDVIFCRNVLIYFTTDAQEKVMSHFYKALNKNGYLILGSAETMHKDFLRKFKLIDLKNRIYKKIK